MRSAGGGLCFMVGIQTCAAYAVCLCLCGQAVERYGIRVEVQLDRGIEICACVDFLGILLPVGVDERNRVFNIGADAPRADAETAACAHPVLHALLTTAIAASGATSIDMKTHCSIDFPLIDDDALHPHLHHGGKHLLPLACHLASRQGHQSLRAAWREVLAGVRAQRCAQPVDCRHAGTRF